MSYCTSQVRVIVGSQAEQTISCHLDVDHTGDHQGIGNVRDQGPLVYTWPDGPVGTTVGGQTLGVREQPAAQVQIPEPVPLSRDLASFLKWCRKKSDERDADPLWDRMAAEIEEYRDRDLPSGQDEVLF